MRVSISLAWNRFGRDAHAGLEMVRPSARNLVANGSRYRLKSPATLTVRPVCELAIRSNVCFRNRPLVTNSTSQARKISPTNVARIDIPVANVCVPASRRRGGGVVAGRVTPSGVILYISAIGVVTVPDRVGSATFAARCGRLRHARHCPIGAHFQAIMDELPG